MLRISILLLLAATLAGCSLVPKFDDVIPDKRTEYKKSKSLPDLEVPPDLTTDAMSDSMNIPNEKQATLSQYQRQRGAAAQSAAPAAAGAPAADEQWVSVRGSRYDVWPKLRSYFQDHGYALELDDTELGVLETDWSKPVTEGDGVFRHKFKVFSEQGADPAVTVLYVTDARQKQAKQADGSSGWVGADKSELAEKQLAGELNVVLSGSTGGESVNAAATPGSATSTAPEADASVAGERRTAELVSAGDGKMYLAIPEEFTHAWQQMELALQRGGFTVEEKDQTNGNYKIAYFDQAAAGEKKGWMSKLAFWRDDEPEGKSYRVNLTGVGERTEVVVLNDKGDWESNEDAARILAVLQHQYNTRE